ncbi:MAG TPA: transketolase C-terminal domain-containing protein [Candidatus Methanomethylicus sp.]|nr:transketolase C-terminal domain-containing protein [Candidatus Methanomethylicus sp.]
MRAIFGEALSSLGEENYNLVVLTADVAKPTCVYKFAEAHPSRFFNVGISEQDMIGIASGLSLSGSVPVVAAFAPFLMRAWEQVRSTVARANLNVKMVGTHAGLSASDEGGSHQSLEDVALMRVLPNMTVVVPGDRQEIAEATRAIVAMKGPVYMRLGRDESLSFLEGERVFSIGRAVTVADGSDITVFSNGSMTAEVLAAAESLDIGVKVVHVPTVKPLDSGAIVSAARETGLVACVEEHSVIGGLGSAVAELLSGEYPVPVKRIGVNDAYGESGPQRELLRKHGLVAESIGESLKRIVRGSAA